MTTTVDTLVDRYLTDLAAELRDLPANRRRELLDEVSEHIAEARATQEADNEAAVRTVLERLGDPADIAAAARERFGIAAKPARQATPWLGWVVGVVLVWISPIWTTRDKLIGTLGGLSWVLAGLGTIMAEAVNLPLSASGSDTPVGAPHIVESTGPSASRSSWSPRPSSSRSPPPSIWPCGCAATPTRCPPLADARQGHPVHRQGHRLLPHGCRLHHFRSGSCPKPAEAATTHQSGSTAGLDGRQPSRHAKSREPNTVYVGHGRG